MKYKLAINLIIASCMLITIHAKAQSSNTKELKSLILSSFGSLRRILSSTPIKSCNWKIAHIAGEYKC